MFEQNDVSNNFMSVVSYSVFNLDGTFKSYPCASDDVDFKYYAYAITLHDNSVSERYGELIASIIIHSSIPKNQSSFNRHINQQMAQQQPLLAVLKNTPISIAIMDMPSFTN